jgi:hypothetical protein
MRTPLLNIRNTMDEIRITSSKLDHRSIWMLDEELRGQYDSAARWLAQLNGWTYRINSPPFGLRQIALQGPRGTFHTTTTIFDHCIRMKARRRPAAIICQPYSQDRACLAEASELARLHDVALHVPPQQRASIHYPDWAMFFVFTDRSHAMRWLPEQVHGIRPRVRRVYIVANARLAA